MLNVIVVYSVLMSFHCSNPGEKLPTYVARKIPLTIMNNVYVNLKGLFVPINIPTLLTRVGWLFLFPFSLSLILITRFALVMLEIVFVFVALAAFFTLVLHSSVFSLMLVH